MGTSGTDLAARPVAPTAVATAPSSRSWLRRWWPLVSIAGLLLATIVVSIFVKHVIYPGRSWNRDESTYLWQVRALRAGDLLAPTGGLAPFFHPWLTGIRNGQFFSQYTLGWPGVMYVVDVLFGSSQLSIVFGCLVAIIGTYVFTREITRDTRLALLTSALFLACPIFIIESGMYLGYLFSLGIGLLFTTALLRGLQGERAVWIVAAGGLLGVLFITRPLDAVLWALAACGYVIFITWKQWRRQLRLALRLFIGFVPFLVLTLAHNKIVTGRFTQFPFTAKEPRDTFGFGIRQLMPLDRPMDYTPKEAVKGTLLNAYYFPQFIIGTYVGMLAVFTGMWLRRRDRTTLLLLAIAVAFPAGYFIFWGNRLSSGFAYLSGPVYFIPLYVPACIFLATTLIALWRRRRAFVVVLACAMLIATAPFMYDKAAMNHHISAAQEPWRHATDALHGKSLVIVRDSGPYDLHLNPFSENAPDLNNRILYSVDQGADNLRLIDQYPDRKAYIEVTSNPALDDTVHSPDATPPTISIFPANVKAGGAVTFHVSVRNPRNQPAVMATLHIGHRVDQRRLVATPAGDYATDWTLVPSGTPDAPPGAVPVTGQGTINITAGAGASISSTAVGNQAREQFLYRVHAGRLEVLTPSRFSLGKPQQGRIVFDDVPQLSTLRVDLSSS